MNPFKMSDAEKNGLSNLKAFRSANRTVLRARDARRPAEIRRAGEFTNKGVFLVWNEPGRRCARPGCECNGEMFRNVLRHAWVPTEHIEVEVEIDGVMTWLPAKRAAAILPASWKERLIRGDRKPLAPIKNREKFAL